MRTKHSVLGNHLPVEHDYKLLPSACSTFEEKNPGSIAKCETDGDSHFTRFLILFHAQAQRCVKGGKHVFAIDGAFTKPDSQFKGQLLNISGFDANGQVVTIGYALVETEVHVFECQTQNYVEIRMKLCALIPWLVNMPFYTFCCRILITTTGFWIISRN